MKKLITVLLFITSLLANTIATGYRGTSDYAIISDAIQNTDFAIEQTKGDIQSLRQLLKNPSVSLAVVQENILFDLVRQDPSFKEKLTILAPLYPAAIILIVPQKSEIESIKDLSSKRLLVDLEGSGDYYTFLDIQEKLLINPEIFNIKKTQAFQMLRAHKADAYFFIGNIQELVGLSNDYKLIPITLDGFHFKNFSLGKKERLTTSYVTKYLVHANKKSFSKHSLQNFLTALLKESDRNFLCSFNEKTPLPKEDYIYFACSQPIITTATTQSQKPSKRTVKAALYYDRIEDITLYPLALRDRNFKRYGTSYMVEKVKFDNVVKLMKKELHKNPDAKFLIVSKGKEANAIRNMELIYKKLKKAHIPRSNLIKRVIPVRCNGECFMQTTIKFESL